MSSFVVYSIILLWGGFIALLVINVALLRQFGVLFERIAPVGALSMNAQLQAGDRAPEISLTSLLGEPLTIGAKGREGIKTFLFFLSPSCTICKNLLPVVQQFERDWHEVRVLYASAGEDAQLHENFIKKYQLPRDHYVVSDQLGMIYGVSKLPYAILLDEDAKIISLGLVNTREHIESLKEAELLKAGTLQEYLGGAKEKQLEGEKNAR